MIHRRKTARQILETVVFLGFAAALTLASAVQAGCSVAWDTLTDAWDEFQR